MEGIEIFGFVAGTVTALGMSPQLIKTLKTKEVEELSIKMFVLYLLGFGMWITYGAIRSDVPIIVTNSISIVMTSIMIYLKLRYKDANK